MTDIDDDYDDEDDLDLSTLPTDELVEQMHDDLYNGFKRRNRGRYKHPARTRVEC